MTDTNLVLLSLLLIGVVIGILLIYLGNYLFNNEGAHLPIYAEIWFMVIESLTKRFISKSTQKRIRILLTKTTGILFMIVGTFTVLWMGILFFGTIL